MLNLHSCWEELERRSEIMVLSVGIKTEYQFLSTPLDESFRKRLDSLLNIVIPETDC